MRFLLEHNNLNHLKNKCKNNKPKRNDFFTEA